MKIYPLGEPDLKLIAKAIKMYKKVQEGFDSDVYFGDIPVFDSMSGTDTPIGTVGYHGGDYIGFLPAGWEMPSDEPVPPLPKLKLAPVVTE